MYMHVDKAQKASNKAEEYLNSDHAVLVKAKVRGAGKSNKHHQKIIPARSSLAGFFGINTVKPDDRYIVVTEGEYDAMAVH